MAVYICQDVIHNDMKSNTSSLPLRRRAKQNAHFAKDF